MGNMYTYSFEDTMVTISHPSFGSYSAYGTGIGTLSVEFSNDVTSHEVAADQAVLVTKSVKKNGSVKFDVLQSSDFNTWLKKLAAYVEAADSSQFALAVINIRNKSTGESFYCTGVSHQKKPGASYQAVGQNKSWTMMAANIEAS